MVENSATLQLIGRVGAVLAVDDIVWVVEIAGWTDTPLSVQPLGAHRGPSNHLVTTIFTFAARPDASARMK